ncbi:MAG: peroxidase [Planctomycetes bacterium]|nr:peroxidase [Planctomycetota bacterium]
MAWIRTISETEAGSDLKRLYGEMLDPRSGKVDHVLKVHGLNPEGLRAHWTLYRAAMRATPGLRKVEREMIACVVSSLNGCHY